MGLEAATYIQDLNESYPETSDLVQQGDNHIRLLKEVLKATFPTTTRAFFGIRTEAKLANFSVTGADENKVFTVATAAAAVTATLPALVGADAGWACHFIKSDSSLNAFHVAPASGFVQSGAANVTRARRSIQGSRFSAIWDGSNWLVERIAREPVGSIIALGALGVTATAPCGYELAYGQTLASFATNYQEYSAIVNGAGTVPDLRGRVVAGRDNMGGTAASLLTGAVTGGIVGTNMWGLGGTEYHALAAVEVGTHTHPVNITSGNQGANHTHTGTTSSEGAHTHSGSILPDINSIGAAAAGGAVFATDLAKTDTALSLTSDGSHTHTMTTGIESATHTHTVVGNTSNNVGGGNHNNTQPTIIMNYLIVVE